MGLLKTDNASGAKWKVGTTSDDDSWNGTAERINTHIHDDSDTVKVKYTDLTIKRHLNYASQIDTIDANSTISETTGGTANLTLNWGYSQLIAGGGGAVGNASLQADSSFIDFDKDQVMWVSFKGDGDTDGTATNFTGGESFGLGEVRINGLIAKGCCFLRDVTDGKVYARTGTGAAGTTSSEITGITWANWNVFRIVHDAGTNVKFYVNDTLKATINTNIPAGTLTTMWTVWTETGNGSSKPHLLVVMGELNILSNV